MHLPKDTTIASGPVIIEDNKVLLNREQKDYGVSPWFFPGGGVENFDITLEETSKREAKEEMGIEIEIIRPMRTLLLDRPDRVGKIVLVHYLAKRIGEIKPSKKIVEWAWHDIHNLPENCAQNVVEIIKDYIKEK